jgi:hypothetical protein
MTMNVCATPAPVMNHLCPSMIHLSPLRVAVVCIMPAGSEPAPGCGSVIASADRTSPSTMGCSQRAFWSSRATFSNTSMFPSSGGAQLNAAGPKSERLISS